jgi:hypothetical protein
MPKQVTAEDARARIEPGWNRLNELLSDIPIDRVERPGVNGDWTIKILLGHISYWERNAAKVIRLLADGQSFPPIETDVINAELAQTDMHRPYAELRQEFDEAHAALLATIDETVAVDGKQLSWDTWRHYPEHIKQLENWRKTNGI